MSLVPWLQNIPICKALAAIQAVEAFGRSFPVSKQNLEVAREPETSPGNSPENPTVESNANPQPDEKLVAELAYRRWVEKGCPQQSDQEDWLEAEREFRIGKPNGQ
jgi:hypothetical protein